MKKILQFLVYLCFLVFFFYLFSLFSHTISALLQEYVFVCSSVWTNSWGCRDNYVISNIIANVVSLILFGITCYIFFKYCHKFIQSLSSKIIVGIFLLLAIVFTWWYFLTHKEFQWLPTKVVIRSWDDNSLYAIDLSKTYFNKWYLSVVAEPIKSMTGMLSNKNIINGEYSIGEYSLLKNWKKIYTLDFGYDQSFIWYKNSLIFKWVKYYNNKEDIGGKIALQMSKIVVMDIVNKQEYWISIVDPKKINEKYQNIHVNEVVGYIE